ncbi:MAG: two-component system OmpR family response regulator [Litorivivens sp.]|jgi:two-component system OmpR family response regulator
MSALPRILLVEDEENFGAVLRNYLELSKFQVDWAVNGKLGYSKFRQQQYDLCVFDVMMPEKDGFELAKDVREINPTIPILFLTARGDKEDQVKGFKIGADDYITKPFDTELLLYKIKAILKRKPSQDNVQEKWEIGEFTFTKKTRMLESARTNRRLTPKESQLFELLCQHQNEVMPRQKALLEIWKNDDYFTTRSMDVYIAKLRKHLSIDGSIQLENIHGEGYILRHG